MSEAPPAAKPAPQAQPGVIADPYRAYNFKILVGPKVQGHFTRVDGLGIKVPRILYRAGGENSTVRAIPGPVEYTPVTLRFGVTDSIEMVEWLFTAVTGKVLRQNVSIVMLDIPGEQEKRRWNLIDAWPCEWYGAPLDALGGSLAIETVTFACDRIELDKASAPKN